MPLLKTRQALFIVFIALIGTGCTQSIHSLDLADPVLYANQNGGCDADAPDCRYNTGLLLAVWPDGRVLRTESADTIGLRYVMGSPSARLGDAVMAIVGELEGLTDMHAREVSPGAASHQVIVATADGLATSWHFEIPVQTEQPAFIEERLISIMQTDLADQRSIHWSDLPRFDSPVIGNWRSVHRPR